MPREGALFMAERVGFEPTIQLPGFRFSRPVHSTTLPPLRGGTHFSRLARAGQPLRSTFDKSKRPHSNQLIKLGPFNFEYFRNGRQRGWDCDEFALGDLVIPRPSARDRALNAIVRRSEAIT